MQKHILITDDDPTLLTLYRTMFRSSLCEIDYASDAEECAELLESRHYDLALLDIELGRDQPSGIDILASHGRGVPVVMMSTRDDPNTVATCAALGAKGFLSKNRDFARRIAETVLKPTCQFAV